MRLSKEDTLASFKEGLFEKGKLYQQVFGTDAGKQVLRELVSVYVKPAAFDSDPLKMARNVANHDLVKLIVELTELSDE